MDHHAARLGVNAYSVQEDRLSDAAEAVENQAAGRQPFAEAVKSNRSPFNCVVAPGESLRALHRRPSVAAPVRTRLGPRGFQPETKRA
jgi:hypothetical protein